MSMADALQYMVAGGAIQVGQGIGDRIRAEAAQKREEALINLKTKKQKEVLDHQDTIEDGNVDKNAPTVGYTKDGKLTTDPAQMAVVLQQKGDRSGKTTTENLGSGALSLLGIGGGGSNSPWELHNVTTDGGYQTPYKHNKLTGETYMLTGSGWLPMPNFDRAAWEKLISGAEAENAAKPTPGKPTIPKIVIPPVESDPTADLLSGQTATGAGGSITPPQQPSALLQKPTGSNPLAAIGKPNYDISSLLTQR